MLQNLPWDGAVYHKRGTVWWENDCCPAIGVVKVKVQYVILFCEVAVPPRFVAVGEERVSI